MPLDDLKGASANRSSQALRARLASADAGLAGNPQKFRAPLSFGLCPDPTGRGIPGVSFPEA